MVQALRRHGNGNGITIVGQRTPKVAFGFPYGPISAPFMHSKEALREYEVAKMAEGLPIHVHHVLPQGGLYIDHNRNIIVERFLTTDAEWLLQIDTDIEFPPTIVETLLRIAGHDKKIVGASVPLGPPLPSCAWMKTDQPGIWRGLAAKDITEGGVPVDGIATAVIIIHREVIEAIADREGQRWFLKFEVGRLSEPRSKAAWEGNGPMRDRKYVPIGEDLAFCIRAADAGYQSWCAKVPGLRHYKTLPMSHDYELPEPALAQEA